MSPGWCSFGNAAGGAGIQQHGVHLNTKERQSSGACSSPCSGRVLSCVIAGLSQALITADQGENLSEEKEKKTLAELQGSDTFSRSARHRGWDVRPPRPWG